MSEQVSPDQLTTDRPLDGRHSWSGAVWRGGLPLASGFDQAGERPAPLWLTVGGLTLGVGFAALAAETGGGLESVMLLTAAAAAGGLGAFGLVERLTMSRAGRQGPEASFHALFDRAPEIAALVDRAGRVRRLNGAAAAEASRRGLRPAGAADLLFDTRDPQRVVFELLTAAFTADPAAPAAERRIEGGRVVSASLVSGGLALWRIRDGGAAVAAPGSSIGDARAALERTADGLGRAAAVAQDGGGEFEIAAAAAGVAWFAVGPTGRIVAGSPLFETWTGARAGRRPSLAALFPDLARVFDPGSPPPTKASWPSRLIGAPGAPRAVTISIGPLGDGPDLFAVAAPLPDGAVGAVGLDASPPLALGPAAPGGEARLLDAFDGLSAERVVSEAGIGVLVLSADGRALRLNAAADRLMTDRAAERAGAAVIGPIGDHLIDWIAEEDREQAETRLSAAAGGGAAAFEARLEGPDEGAGRLVQFFLSAIDSAEGRLILCHLIDASEQRGLEQNFIQSQKLQAVGQLAGGVAHDFNNLLTVIIGGADARLRRMTEDDPAYQDLNAIRQAGRRAAWLVSQLLAFSRKQTLTPSIADLTESCSQFVFLLARVIGERYEIATDFEEALWPVEVDVNQFEQVITNLVVNASHAMKRGGAIRVRTANERVKAPREQGNFAMPPGDYVRVTVEDQGCGIPREQLAKIFEPFFTTKPEGKGTGLGLAVVYGVVKQSNGFIFVDSVVDEGTTVTIYLPRVSERRAAEAREAEDGLKRANERAGPPALAFAAPTEVSPPPAAPNAVSGAGHDPLPTEVRAAAALLGRKSASTQKKPTPETATETAAEAGAGAVSRAEAGAAGARLHPVEPGVRGLCRVGVVLLIEDQEAVRSFAARSLAESGHQVIEAESGEEALDVLRDSSRHIDLMLSDVVLEDMDGPSVLREIGAERPEMKVIFMSGYARDYFAETLESASAHARQARFLQKPFTLDDLAEAVTATLGRESEE